MEFTNKFHVPLPLDDAWRLMLDVPRILPCLPGARLTEVLGDDRYRGSVTVKLGPIRLAFDGEAQLVRRDETTHTAWLRGSGLDPKGRGSAESEFSFALTPAATGGTDVVVTTQLVLSGAVAQYGRGSGMIAEVASHILRQFEHNLADSLAADDDVEATPISGDDAGLGEQAASAIPARSHDSTATTAKPVDSASRNSAAGASSAADAEVLLLQAQAVLAQTQAVLVKTQQALARLERAAGRQGGRQPEELNMLSVGAKAMWSQARSSVSRVFRRT